MIFLPNKFARYTAALRNAVQLSVVKRGICEENLKRLMKIHKAEALFEPTDEPLCVGEFSETILCAAFFTLLKKGKAADFSVKLKGNYMLDRKLYTAFLLTAYKGCNRLCIQKHRKQIVFKIKNCEIIPLKPFLKAMNAHCFFERKTKFAIIVINAVATDKPCHIYKNEWDYILNPFSEVNIYL